MTIVQRPNGEVSAELECELRRYNWGAFWFDWIWGLANGALGKTKSIFLIYIVTFIGQLILVFMIKPLIDTMGTVPAIIVAVLIGLILIAINLIAKIYYGLNGNRWAYQGRAFYDIQDFSATQKRWNMAAGICFLVIVVQIVLSLIFVGIGAAITGASFASIASQTAGSSSINSNIVKDIVNGEKTKGEFATGKEAADYLLTNSAFIESNKTIMTASKYGAESIKMTSKNNPDIVYYLFMIKKTPNCNIEAKNCSVIRYQKLSTNDKFMAVEKVYFDKSGNVKQVKITNKK